MKLYVKASTIEYDDFKKLLEADLIWDVLDKIEEDTGGSVDHSDRRTNSGMQNYFDVEIGDEFSRVRVSDKQMFDLYVDGGIDSIASYIESQI